MNRLDLAEIIRSLIAFLTGGGFLALIGWRKPVSEAHKAEGEAALAKASADHIAWQHMLDTIERLEQDIKSLKESRAERDKEIAELKTLLEGCEKREIAFVKRINALESRFKTMNRTRP